jgi:GNAT superfamily N-acetyltransferase
VEFAYRGEGKLRDDRPIVVRFKVPEDLKAWRRYTALVPDDVGHKPGTEFAMADFTTPFSNYDAPFLVAEVGEEIVGAVAMTARDEPHGYHREHVVELHPQVLPGWRRQGVGDALMEGIIEWASAQGSLLRLEAWSLGWNEALTSFLSKHGFEEEGRWKRAWKVRNKDAREHFDEMVFFGRWVGP